MKRFLLIAAAVAPLATACATTGREPRTADVTVPAAFEARGGTLPAASLDQWWTLYGDPQLETLVAQALAQSTDTRAAAARLEEALAIRSAATSQFRPQGALQGSASSQRTEILSGESGGFGGAPGQPGQPGGGFGGFSQEGTTNNAALNFNVSWELDLFGRRRATARAADADLAAARFAYEGTRASLAATVADTLFGARGLALQMEEARQTRRIVGELARITDLRANAGIAAEADVARLEADVAQADAEVRRLDAELRAAKRSLLVLAGRAAEPTVDLAIAAAVAPPPQAPQVVPGLLLARRPDVREAQARLASAAGNLTLAELALFPTFNLQPGVGLNATSGPGFDVTSALWSLGAGLAVPILDRPRLNAQIRAQGARTEQAVVAYERAVQTAFSEAEQALVLLEADRDRVALLRAGAQRARTAYDAAERLYNAGLTDVQTVLDAERAWRGARTAFITAQVQALRRSVQTFRALGGGWTPPEEIQTAATEPRGASR